jgi:hypothetical protein
LDESLATPAPAGQPAQPATPSTPTPPGQPQESSERPDRQAQLLAAARDYIQRLNPDLSTHQIIYVRVLKSPAPYVLEVECATKDG